MWITISLPSMRQGRRGGGDHQSAFTENLNPPFCNESNSHSCVFLSSQRELSRNIIGFDFTWESVQRTIKTTSHSLSLQLEAKKQLSGPSRRDRQGNFRMVERAGRQNHVARSWPCACVDPRVSSIPHITGIWSGTQHIRPCCTLALLHQSTLAMLKTLA